MTRNKQTRNGTMLLVTSDPVDYKNLIMILRGAGYVVQHTTNDRVVQKAEEIKPILIIVDADLTMEPDPFPTLNALHTNVSTQYIPVLLLTETFRAFDPNLTGVKILQRRRIATFRKFYTPEHILWFIDHYLNSYSEALEQDKALEPIERHPRVAPFLSEQEKVIVPILRTHLNPKDGAEMVYIPAGPFLMGDEDQEDNPPHRVELSGFWMYKNLVTVQQYKQFCLETGASMPDALQFDPNGNKPDHPIAHLNWDDAVDYATWARAELPTEAEFEKVAGGPSGLKYPWGNDWDTSKLWCSKEKSGDAGGTHKIGELGISPYGCTDMAGNVWQWCQDWYDFDYWMSDHGPDPLGPPTGTDRVVRGGSWRFVDPDVFRTAFRYSYSPSGYKGFGVGFRCVVRDTSMDGLESIVRS